jgi:hypothetical protein
MTDVTQLDGENQKRCHGRGSQDRAADAGTIRAAAPPVLIA